EGLDPQVLLDPAEEELDAPSAAVELGDDEGCELEVVGEENQGLPLLGVAHTNAPHGVRIGCHGAGEQDDLITGDAGRAVDRSGIAGAEAEVLLRPDHEAGAGLCEAVQPWEVDVAAVEDVDRAPLGRELVEYIDVVDSAAAEVDERGDAAAQV